MSSPSHLQSEWTELYSKTLPSLARAKDPVQPSWPVTLDHCFARIILDITIGEGKEPWDRRLKKPAIRNMSKQQLVAAIEMGKSIQTGEIDLVALDMQSLEARGKGEKKYEGWKAPESAPQFSAGESTSSTRLKRKITDTEAELSLATSNAKKRDNGTWDPTKQQTTLSFSSSAATQSPFPAASDAQPDFSSTLAKIHTHPSLTPYRKRLYATLLTVPAGRYTTYAAMSEYLKSSARAVGNGMRNNPFAPEVPCHRVLAADGSIGGFKGDWGKDGKYTDQKIQLLRGEGVRFDGKGKVVGQPFRGFSDLAKKV